MTGSDSESPWNEVTKALQEASLGEGGEDPLPLDFVSGSGLSKSETPEKIPLEKAYNLWLLREAAAGFRNDRLSREEFLAQVGQVARVATEGLKLLGTPGLRKQFENLPPEHAALVDDFEDQAYALKEATDLMASYAKTGNIDELDRGLAVAEQCMVQVDCVQDEAAELATEQAAEV